MRTVALVAVEIFLANPSAYQYSRRIGIRGRVEETYTAGEILSALSTCERH